MPSLVPLHQENASFRSTGVIKFTNCRLVKGNNLIDEDLWISSVTGKIVNGQETIYGNRTAPDRVIDLGGRILSPGFIDVQLNGAYGFDFSVVPEDGIAGYSKGVSKVNKRLISTGVTSYLPTLTSQPPEVYQKVQHSPSPTTPNRLDPLSAYD